ncbi:hypothetical protein MTR62_17435 [Novosphingobium sp. 1949]|uniref:Secretin/TonB short N-terminal domain-containing protein n=1 Tax=Novosphingobium organovorum TaxID=2930092 RepID=A0ABT0BHG1_9SPHN|nr:hypothetical protein [Novosphingobium organovorum]MCJ2184460.1 hypothetical protein [Novosphingobium organovorum]
MIAKLSPRAGVSVLALSLACLAGISTPCPVQAARVQTFDFAIPAQDLSGALKQYSRVTGLPIAAWAEALRGRTSPGVSGRLSHEEALARLLAGSGVETSRKGAAIIVRGLSTELNNYSINGLRLGGAGSRDDVFYRGVRLSVLPPRRDQGNHRLQDADPRPRRRCAGRLGRHFDPDGLRPGAQVSAPFGRGREARQVRSPQGGADLGCGLAPVFGQFRGLRFGQLEQAQVAVRAERSRWR